MGITLGEIIYDIGGGILGDRQFKAVQTADLSAACIPPQFLNVKVDFDSLRSRRGHGSGGMIVVDEDTCMWSSPSSSDLRQAKAAQVRALRRRRQAHARNPEPHLRGKGCHEDLAAIRKIAEAWKRRPLRPGQLTRGPVMAALRYFENEFIAHIEDKRCPAALARTGAGALPERLPGRSGRADLREPGRRRALRRGLGGPPRAQPLRHDLRPRLPGFLRTALRGATSTLPSASARSNGSWPIMNGRPVVSRKTPVWLAAKRWP